MFTLRDFLGAHVWLAMSTGHTVGSALMQLRDDGVPVDCPVWFAGWRGSRADRVLWGDLAQRLRGPLDNDPTVKRWRENGRRERVLSRFRADRQSVDEIAREESMPVIEVERIVREEMKRQRADRAEHKRAVAARATADAERRERFHEAFRRAGRRMPASIEKMLEH